MAIYARAANVLGLRKKEANKVDPGAIVQESPPTREFDLAYLAGIMDSDGHFGISKRPSPHGGFYYWGTCVLQWRDSGSARQILQEIQRDFRGHISRLKTTSSLNPHGRSVRWSVSHRGASDFCGAILPHLRLKREQAATIISLQRAKKPNGRSRTQADREFEEVLYQRIRTLNGSVPK